MIRSVSVPTSDRHHNMRSEQGFAALPNMVDQLVSVPSAVLRSVKFDFMTGHEMETFSVTSVSETSDLTSSKLGLPNPSSECETCGSSNIGNCHGHFGVIKLPATVYHPNFVKEVVQILNQVCPGCKSLKATEMKRVFNCLNEGEGKNYQSTCKYCSSDQLYPRMKFKSIKDKLGSKVFSIVIEIPPKKLPKALAEDYWDFVPQDLYADHFLSPTTMTLSPFQAFSLLKCIDQKFIEKFVPKRELMFLSCIPVTSNSHRITERRLPFVDGPELIFDQRTNAYKSLVILNRSIDSLKSCGRNFNSIEMLKFISCLIHNCLSSANLQRSKPVSKERTSSLLGSRWLKDVVLGKRSDHTFSMVVVGDPKIGLGEIGIPLKTSERLVVLEAVTRLNIEKLKETRNKNPGRFRFHKKVCSGNTLEIEDVVYRPLEDGDIVLVNRPPSVHQHSLIALRVKTLPKHSALSINPLCCAPLKGDFDGDLLLGYIPQSVQCKVELDQLVGLDSQLFDGQDGSALLSLSHDSLTAAYLLTGTDILLNKFQMQQLQMLCPYQMGCPAIVKSPSQMPIWTGRQLFSSLLPPTFDLTTALEDLYISKGEIILSPNASSWLQNKKTGIFSSLFQQYDRRALDFLFAAQDLLCNWISDRGFSVSLNDLYLCADLCSRKKLMDEVKFGLEEANQAFQLRTILAGADTGSLMDHESIKKKSNLKSGLVKKHPVAAFKEVYQDLPTLLHYFAGKDNSLLQMAHSGSKGNLAKIFQQVACLGLQLSENLMSFQVHPKIKFDICRQWKLSCLEENLHAASEHRTNDVCIAVESSFLDGLNPLECLLHASSARANFFSSNAEIPGTLNKNLMLRMRDLYVTYDGTIRSPYGQQIIQFCCNRPDNNAISKDKASVIPSDSSEPNKGGEPAGALAACSITEAAYAGLDQPTSSFEPSPLINLKKVLGSALRCTTSNQTISLALSKKLKRWNCGFEYAALAVKNHLERVILSDIVDTVLIIYACEEVLGSAMPWIPHFHLNKQRMLQKGVTIRNLIEVLREKIESNEAICQTFSNLYISSWKCHLIEDAAKDDDTACFIVAAACPNYAGHFDDIRDILIPAILETVVKGFSEYEKVDIIWDDPHCSPRLQKDSPGELFLKVNLSSKCSPRRSWNNLLNACIPIMDLIDWKQSHPDNIGSLFQSHGIESAWKYFFKSLKISTCNLGRSIHDSHLSLVADCFTVNGHFNRSAIRSPILQATSCRPGNVFINAAKAGVTDNLFGTIEAVTWGKEIPFGTGGSFSIIYPVKVQVDNPRNVYEELHQWPVQQNEPEKISSLNKRHVQQNMPERVSSTSNAWESAFVSQDLLSKKAKEHEWHSKATKLVPPDFSTKLNSGLDITLDDLRNRLKAIYEKYHPNSSLSEEETHFVVNALDFHPNRKEKIGAGITEIKIGHHPNYEDTKCFLAVRKDGTTVDFSYRKIITAAAAAIMKDSEKLKSW